MAEFKPVPDSKIGELSATFNIVVGVTPNEDQLKERKSRSRSEKKIG